MNKPVKIAIVSVVLTLVAFMLYGLTKATFGNYFINSPFNYVLLIIGMAMVLYGVIKGLQKIWTLSLFGAIIMTSCNYAKSNQQVVVSDDCGMTWKKINAGDAVPKGAMNPCYMKVVIPNYPMQGESKFISNLKDRVRASVHIDYDYSITEPLAFIKQAKYLGKANADADASGALDNSAFEGAENMVIDKRIKDVSKALFISEDIVELDQSDMESKLLIESNIVLEPFGVHLNFITLTFDLDEQTRQAIDVSTAMKIYESKGLQDIGKAVMAERAGATKIIVENKTELPNQE